MIAHQTSQQLIEIVDEIFGAMAGIQLVPCAAPSQSGCPNQHMVAVVQVFGEWQGAVRLDINMELARKACASLTGIAVDQLSMQDIRDAAGELANMTAGCVKSIRAPGARLSLPSVVIGADFEVSLSQGTVVDAAWFGNDTGELTVSIVQKEKEDEVPNC